MGYLNEYRCVKNWLLNYLAGLSGSLPAGTLVLGPKSPGFSSYSCKLPEFLLTSPVVTFPAAPRLSGLSLFFVVLYAILEKGFFDLT